MKKIQYTDFKTFVTTKKAPVQYVDFSTHYVIQAKDGYFEYETIIVKDSNADQTDFEAGIKLTANQTIIDTDGAFITRPKAAKAGWAFDAIPIEVTTSKLNSWESKLVDGTNRSGITSKIYNGMGDEITLSLLETTAVKTIVDFEPPYDYEVIGGQVQQNSKPLTNIRVWVTAVPDVPAGSGGSKEMVGGINLKFLDPADKIEADGRVSKYMTYNATYHTNKLRLTFKYDVGVQHDILIIFEVFKA